MQVFDKYIVKGLQERQYFTWRRCAEPKTQQGIMNDYIRE